MDGVGGHVCETYGVFPVSLIEGDTVEEFVSVTDTADHVTEAEDAEGEKDRTVKLPENVDVGDSDAEVVGKYVKDFEEVALRLVERDAVGSRVAELEWLCERDVVEEAEDIGEADLVCVAEVEGVRLPELVAL